jgi:uncharacterized protein YoxC
MLLDVLNVLRDFDTRNARVEHKLDGFHHHLERLMATVAELTAAVKTVSDDITKLAADVAKIQGQPGGISPTDLDPVLTALQGAATALETLDSSLAPPAPPTA